MPLSPTPPKGRQVVARWQSTSLTQPPPKDRRLRNASSCCRAAGEQVSRQRLRPCPQERQQRVEVAVGQHRAAPGRRFPPASLRHPSLRRKARWAPFAGSLRWCVLRSPPDRWSRSAAQAVKMLAVHDAGQLGVFQRLCAPEAAHLPLQRFHQLLLHAFVAQDVIRSHAGLTGVDVLAPE